MAKPCAGPSCGPSFPFNLSLRGLAWLITFVAILPLTLLFLGPILLTFVGRCIGFGLMRKTEGRRSHLQALMNEDDRRYWASRSESKDAGSGPTTDGLHAEDLSPVNKVGKGRQDWDGIVGFFHPFWYVETPVTRQCH